MTIQEFSACETARRLRHSLLEVMAMLRIIVWANKCWKGLAEKLQLRYEQFRKLIAEFTEANIGDAQERWGYPTAKFHRAVYLLLLRLAKKVRMSIKTGGQKDAMAQVSNASRSDKVRIMLGISLDSWNDIMVWSLAVAAIAAAAVVISTFCVVKLQRQEAADARTQREADDAAFAKYKLDVATQQDILKNQTEQAKRETEKLRRENLELEENLSPRGFNHQERAIEALSAFSGTKAVIEYLPEYECKRLAGYIEFVLLGAKWNLLSKKPNSNDFELREGVIVEVNRFPPRSPDWEKSSEAAEALNLELNRAKIKSIKRSTEREFGS